MGVGGAKSYKFSLTRRYHPFIWLIHTGWQTLYRLVKPPESRMAARRRPSMRTRMKAEDVSCWVEHNQQQQPRSPRDEQPRVQFVTPATPTRAAPDEDSEDELKENPIPTDGGFGWFVVFASFLMHAVCDGASFCFGIVLVMIQRNYNAGRVASMFTASLFLSLPLLLAPIAGFTSDRLGCRMAIIIGGSICTVSCVLSMFCPNMWLFTPIFGFGCGLGMAFIYNAAIVIVTYYFSAKRGTATSLAVAGTGGGTFVFPGLLTLSVYSLTPVFTDLQSALTCFAVAYSIVVVLGLLIRDVEWESDTCDFKLKKFDQNVRTLLEDQESSAKIVKDTLLRRANSLPNLNVIRVDVGSIQSVCEAGRVEGTAEMPARSKSMALFENKNQLPVIQEYSMLNSNLANLEHLDLELANSPCTTVRAQRRRVISKVSMSVDQINEMDDEDFKVNFFDSSSGSAETESSSDDSEMSNDGDSSSSELSEKQIDEPVAQLINRNLTSVVTRAASSAPTSARLVRSSLAPGSSNVSGGRVLASNAIQSRFTSNLLTMGKIPSAPMLVARKKRKILSRTQKSISRRIAEEKVCYKIILRSYPFRYIALSVFCLYFILDVPYVCVYDYGIEHLGLSETTSKSIYSAIGFCNCLSTIVFGKFADHPLTKDKIHWIYVFSMVVVSITLFAATFVTTATEIIVSGGLFGVFITSNYVLQSLIIANCFNGLSIFQSAYSMISMLEGVASFIGPPIFAQLREMTGSYSVVFFTGGIFSLLSGFFLYLSAREMQKEDDEIARIAAERTSSSAEEVPNGTTTRANGEGTGTETETLLDV
ncbi:hypothetical protein L5515_019031 [Caenorhabditis briggsae]|uniref:Uncharacterized protein n=2 Tax=Caenorhabditis briggsae TaxID=6238 RepID=A0AAE9FHV8_CAEBR|nr:hypothetical protein L5515_019031 [Caenorhabditis briggsae]